MISKTLVTLQNYFNLCKPKIVLLIIFTAVVGMFKAVPGMVSFSILFYGISGIALAAASAAAINHIIDQNIDGKMGRTMERPLPIGTIDSRSAIYFALLLAVLSMLILGIFVNPLTAILTALSLIGYAIIYTAFLKYATPQNIVIGGAAGAAPPVLGWSAVTGSIDPHALLLFLIIFTWTPPHFWPLAIYKRFEYQNAGVPMLPVTHGMAFTRLHILLYTIIMFGSTLLPYLTYMSGIVYLVGAIPLNLIFLYLVIKMQVDHSDQLAKTVFIYSTVYLFGIFAFLLLDHYLL